MPNPIQNLHKVDSTSFPYIFEQNVSVPLKQGGLIRCNVYRPKSSGPLPVLVTYGPYGKDIPYSSFHPKSFSEVNPQQKSEHSAWETPDPGYWTSQDYVVVRADERGLGQSPGVLDTMSRGTSEAFFDLVEWCADSSLNPWSSGKVGLLGISYYAGSQWRVAARKPKGLAAMIPWEGMSDYYRDRCRHGGILSNGFIKFWWERQVCGNQYGLPGRAANSKIGAGDTLEGDLGQEELRDNRKDQTVDNVRNRYRDEEYYASKEYDMGDIECPLLSVGNWGGILLHLRGNIEGFTHAGSEFKYLRMITGRHDLPFYYEEEVAIQKSFLDAFLKGDDRIGWSRKGEVPQVDLVLRKGNPGFNDAPAEKKSFPRRQESAWPIPRTKYTRFYLNPDKTLSTSPPLTSSSSLPPPPKKSKLSYLAPSNLSSPSYIQFLTPPFEDEQGTEITGHVTARLLVSVTPLSPTPENPEPSTPSELDLFLTLRHFDSGEQEIFYTGTAGDPVPLTKGWLRVSLRKTDPTNEKHRPWLPYREYASTDVQPVIQGQVYSVDVEIWPTNVVVEKGGRLCLEVASGDTQGSGIFTHDDDVEDRRKGKLEGWNHLHFGGGRESWVELPIIPKE